MAQTQYKSIDLRGYIDLNKNELRNATLQNLGSDIGTPVDGLIFYRSDTDRARLRANGVWVDLATLTDVAASGISPTIVDVKGDLIVASAADTVVRKAAGANGTYLQAQSGQSDGLLWTTIADADLPSTITRDTEVFLLSAYTTKGDIGIATGAGVVARHGVSANGTFLVANSANADGWENRAITAADIQEKIATSDLTDWPRVASLDLNNQKITGLLDGTAASDAATFGQVNAILEGRQWKDPVATATTGALPNSPTYSAGAGTLTAGSNTTLAAQAGHTLLLNERILVKDQASTFQDGLYSITALGSGAAPWVLTRTSDSSTAAELSNATTMVEASDSTLKGKIYTQQNTLADLTSAAQSYTITGDNNTYTADGTTITLSGNQFAVTTGGISNAQINGSAAIAYTKLNLTTSIVNGDINASAAIAYSKLALSNSIVNADIASGAAIVYSKLSLANGIVNADINTSAAIAYSKLNLTTSIVNGDINASAAIAYTKLNLATSLVYADVATADTATRIVRKFSQAITGGATSEVITHNLNTRDLANVRLINNNTPWDMVEVEWAATSVNTITLSSPVNLPASYRVIIAG